jgi:outer membrane protein assembly factor BamB
LQESVLAIDLYSGHVNWVRRLRSLDAWTGACGKPQFKALCPETPGPDSDFGMAPTFIPGGGVSGTDVLVIGQKNGDLWSLVAETGVIEWSTVVGPGSQLGGLSWGIAADEQQVYFTEITYGAFGAALLTSGAPIWETPAPLNLGSKVPPTVVGDLVLTGATNDSTHRLLALTKATGGIIFNMTLDTYSQGGIAVYNNFIFLGTGYQANGSFYVFTVDA